VLQEDPEKARVTINNWISNQTENLIQDTLPEGALDSSTMLVLVNTIYFKVPEPGPLPRRSREAASGTAGPGPAPEAQKERVSIVSRFKLSSEL